MAGAGFKTFNSGDILGATDVNTYLMQQSVMVFATTSARASAISSPSAGMLTWITNTKTFELYDGSGWTAVSGGDFNNFPNQVSLVTGGVARPLPYAMEQGSAVVTGTLAVTFTSSRFTVAPQVLLTVVSSTGTASSATLNATPSTSGFTINVWNGTVASTVARTVYWQAIQMKSVSANG
jgi:hypothetical protein